MSSLKITVAGRGEARVKCTLAAVEASCFIKNVAWSELYLSQPLPFSNNLKEGKGKQCDLKTIEPDTKGCKSLKDGLMWKYIFQRFVNCALSTRGAIVNVNVDNW